MNFFLLFFSSSIIIYHRIQPNQIYMLFLLCFDNSICSLVEECCCFHGVGSWEGKVEDNFMGCIFMMKREFF